MLVLSTAVLDCLNWLVCRTFHIVAMLYSHVINSTVNADLIFQVFEPYDREKEILMGWEGDELAYIVVFEGQIGDEKPKRF